jgi:6-phosphogluconolactonase (cycloisomerase 2 family)
MAALSITTGTLGHITNSPFATTANGTANAPYTLAAWPPPLPAPAAAVTTKFLYAGIPATQKGGVITRVLGRQLVGTVTGGILRMPINGDHTLGAAQVFATGSDDYDPIAVTPSPGNFLYAIDLTTNHLAAFSIDSSKGTLTAIGPQGPPVGVAVGPDPFNVVVDPQGKYVFVANCDCVTNPQNLGSVSVFSIQGDGTLMAVPGSPFHLGVAAVSARPIAMAVSPDNKFLFVASLAETAGAADEVYVESIAANGALADAVSGAPSVDLPVGSTPVSIAVSTDGNYVYTGNAGTQTVATFLNCLQATPPAGCPLHPPPPLAVPSVNSTNAVGGTVGAILIDTTNPPPSTTGSTTPTTASGFLYVTDYDHGIVVSFSIISTNACVGIANCIPGTLTPSGAAANTGGINPFGLAIAH